jgi:hypothetical protein
VVNAWRRLSPESFDTDRAARGSGAVHADAVVLANILRADAHAHRPLPADSERPQAVAVLAAPPRPSRNCALTGASTTAASSRPLPRPA